MNFTSKFHTSARIVAVAVLMTGTLPGPAFAQLGGPPHAPYLTRNIPHKAARLANGSIAVDRPAAGTQSDIAAQVLGRPLF